MTLPRLHYLGVADTETGINGAPHAPDFAADERAIGHGVRAMAGLLTDRPAARSAPGDRLGLRSKDTAYFGPLMDYKYQQSNK